MILDALFRQAEETRVRVITGAGIDQDATLKRVFGTGPETTAGVSVDEEDALGISAYYCGVRLLSWGVGQLPLGIYRRNENGDKTPLTTRPEYRVLHNEPNPEMSSMKWREIGQVMRLQWGRSINWIERDAMGRLVRVWPLHTRDVQRERRPDGDITYDTSRCKDEDEFPRPPDMPVILFRHDTIDVANFDGRSVLARAREELGESIAAQQLGAGFLAGGSNYAFALSTEKSLKNEAKVNLRTQLEKVHGIRRRIPILDEGMKLEKFGMPLDEAQFLESRQWFISQVARWLDIPPHKLKDLSRATFSNIYEQRLEWLESLLPHLLQWDKEITRKVFGKGMPNVFCEHIVEGILKADIEKRYAAHRDGIQWGFTTPNEVRRRENWNSLGAAGDVVLIPQNMHLIPTTDEAKKLYIELGLVKDPDAPEPPPPPQIPPPGGDQEGDGDQDGQPPDNKAAQDAAKRTLKDRLRFAVSREVGEVCRAAGKKKNFLGWLDRFYSRALERFEKAIEPAAETCRVLGLDVDAERIAFEHCRTAHAALLELTGQVTPDELGDRLATETSRWEIDVPAAVLQMIDQKEKDNG